MLKKQPVTYICKINYKKTPCPLCQTKGKYEKQDLDLVCKVCGAIIETPYQYVGGIKFNNNIHFKKKKIYRDKK